MKVLLVSEYFPPIIHGGGEISAYLLAKTLTKKGIDVSVLTSHFDEMERYEVKDNFKIYRKLKTGKGPHNIKENIKRATIFNDSVKREVKRLDKIENFDVIHALNTTSILGISKIKFPKKKKLFATINGYHGLCPKNNLFYMEKEVCSGCNPNKYIKCISKSKYIGKQIIKSYMKYNPLFLSYLYDNYLKKRQALNKFHIFSISDFITNFTKKYVKKSTKTYNLFEINDKIIKYLKIEKLIKNKTIISSIGNLETIKGVDLLLNSYSKIKDKKDSMILIIGDGSTKSYLKKLCEKLNISKKVHFTGKLDYKFIPYIYKISDIVTIFSKYPEPFSRIMLEATYFSKPLIGTNVGGNPEGIIDGKNGYLVDFNENNISKKIETLIENKKLRENMGKESKKIFNDKFDNNKIIKTIIDAYKLN